MAKSALIFALALTTLAGCAMQPAKLPDSEAAYASLVQLQDSPLETSAVLTSPSAGYMPPGAEGVNANDVLLRAFVDKKTRKVDYQVYVRADQSSGAWADFYAINFLADDGTPRSEPTVKVKSDVNCYGTGSHDCVFDEHVAASVAESVLRSIRVKYTPADTNQRWPILVKGHTMNLNLSVPYGQVAGLLQRVDAYQASLGQPISQTSN